MIAASLCYTTENGTPTQIAAISLGGRFVLEALWTLVTPISVIRSTCCTVVDDGYFLCGPTGNIATLEEIRDYSEKLLDFATRFEKDIVIHNLKNDARLEKLLRGDYPKSKKKLPKKRRVYLMECNKRYKVGVSIDPDARLEQLDNRPFPIHVIAQSDMVHCAFEAERELHEFLDEYRIDGEWFEIPNRLVENIADCVRYVSDAAHGYKED